VPRINTTNGAKIGQGWESETSLGIVVWVVVRFPSLNYLNPWVALEKDQSWKVNN
jgi:hypothetical protein